MRLVLTAAVLAGVSLAPASAQTLKKRVAPQIGQTANVPIKPFPQAQEKVELRGIPMSMISVDKSAIPWIVSDRPAPVNRGGIQPEPEGLYLGAFAHLTDGRQCSDYQFKATLDLSTIRAHGFRLLEVQKIPTSPPAGFGFDLGPNEYPSPLPRPSPSRSLRNLRAYVFYEWVYGQAYGRMHQCRAIIHQRIWVIGPKGIDPITGNKIAPRREPN